MWEINVSNFLFVQNLLSYLFEYRIQIIDRFQLDLNCYPIFYTDSHDSTYVQVKYKSKKKQYTEYNKVNKRKQHY